MKVSEVTGEELKAIQTLKYKRCKLQNVLLEFHDSEAEAIKINWNEEGYADGKSAQSSFHIAIKKLRLNMTAITRNDLLYIIKL